METSLSSNIYGVCSPTLNTILGDNFLWHQSQGYVHVQLALRSFLNALALVCLVAMSQKVVPGYSVYWQ